MRRITHNAAFLVSGFHQLKRFVFKGLRIQRISVCALHLSGRGR